MLRLPYRQLVHDPLRTALTAVALAAVVAVILVLEGFEQGFVAQARRLVLERNADLIVAQAGIATMFGGRSILPQFARRDVETVEGVAAAHPLTGIGAIYEDAHRDTPIYVLVYDTAGGPRQLIAGAAPAEPRGIVIDRSIADQYALRPGDPFVLSDFEFRIAGITTGAATMMTPFAFVRFDDLLDFYFESDLAADISTFPLLSYLLVELEPGSDRLEVAERIERLVPAGDVFLPERLAESDAELVRTVFGPVFELLIAVAYLIGLLVTAIIMFAAVLARQRSFGVLKALGFSPAFLSLSVVIEIAALAVVAVPAGMLLAAGIASAFEAALPLYLILPLEPAPVVRTATGLLAFAALGGLVPVSLIRRVDPAVAFRS
jgi:putative ABC transport system permease protein